jgi:CysZ protein
MENGGLRFAQTRKLLHRRRGLSLGFGGAVAVALLLPGINLLVMPAAVAGATLLWVERLRTTSHLRE